MKKLFLSVIMLICLYIPCLASYESGEPDLPDNKSVIHIEYHRYDLLNSRDNLLRKTYITVPDSAVLLYKETIITSPSTGEYYEYIVVYHYSEGPTLNEEETE